MICKNCNKEISEDFVYCPFCGKRADGKKICPKCGAEIDEVFSFCPKCGADQNEVKTAVVKEDRMPAKAEGAYFAEKAPSAEDEVLFDIKESPAEKDRSVKKEKKKKSFRVTKEKFEKIRNSMDNGLIGHIVLVAVTFVFFICSFFTVFEVNMSDTVKFAAGEDAKFEGDIRMRYTAVSLMDFAFFALTADAEDAQDYIDKVSESDNYIEKIIDVLSEEGMIKENELTGRITVTKKACNKISDIMSEANLFKISYASGLAEVQDNMENPSAAVNNLITAGILAMINVIVCGAAFIASVVLLLARKNIGGVRMVAIVLASSAAFAAYLSTFITVYGLQGDDGIFIGGALSCIIAFSVVFFAYRLAVRIMSEKKESVKKLIVNATAVVAGIIVLSCAALPAIETTLTYNPENENLESTEFKYSLNQFDTFNEYYIGFGEDNYPESAQLKEVFDVEAVNYTESISSRREGNVYFKSAYGIQRFLNTRYIADSYGFVRIFGKFQPVFSLIALYAVATMFSMGLAYLCGGKDVKAVKGIALILLLISAAYGMFTTVLLNFALNTSELLPDADMAVGSAPILQLVIAVIAIVGFIVAKIFKNKYFGRNEDDPAIEEDEDDCEFTEIALN